MRISVKHWRAILLGIIIGFIPVCFVSLILGQGFGGELDKDNTWSDASMLFATAVFPILGGWLAVRAARRRESGNDK